MFRYIIATAAALLLFAGCTDTEQFRVNGTIEGKPTMNMRVGYYADGVYHTLITAARDGEFEFFGASRQPTVVEILDYDYRPMGRLYVGNGQTVECRLTRGNPYVIEAEGNDVTNRWTAFLRTNADSLIRGGAAANNVIDRYIRSNPDNIVSTLLLMTSYDSSLNPAMADSLLASITPQARPSFLTEAYNFMLQRLVSETVEADVLPIKYLDLKDSIRTFRPSARPLSLLAVSDSRSKRADSIVPVLRRMESRAASRLGILDMIVEGEKSQWRRVAAPDSAKWEQGWTPGGIASVGIDRLGISALPYFIICDSTGRQLLRTPSAGRAAAYADSLLKATK